jgi:hypothetical protein
MEECSLIRGVMPKGNEIDVAMRVFGERKTNHDFCFQGRGSLPPGA